MSGGIAAVYINGAALSLDTVVAYVENRHGREGFADEPLASTSTLELISLNRDELLAIDVGDTLVLELDDGAPAFTGRITDLGWTRPDPDTDAHLHIIATGNLPRLGGAMVGGLDWPREPWSVRARRIFLEAGLDDPLEPPTDPLPPLLDDFDIGAGVALAAPWTAIWAPGVPVGDGAGNVYGPAPANAYNAYHAGLPLTGPIYEVAATFYGLDVTLTNQTWAQVGLHDPVTGAHYSARCLYGDYGALEYFHPDTGESSLLFGAFGVPGADVGLKLVYNVDRLQLWAFPVNDPAAIALVWEAIDARLSGRTLYPFFMVYNDPIDAGYIDKAGAIWAGERSARGVARSPVGPRAIESTYYVLQPPPDDYEITERLQAPGLFQYLTAAEALAQLLQASGGALIDLPDGRILVQALEARKAMPVVGIPPALVAYSPEWVKVLDVVNEVEVIYGPPPEGDAPPLSREARDDDSIAKYGYRNPGAFDSHLADDGGANAQHRADLLIAAGAWPNWRLPHVDLLARPALTPGIRLDLWGLPDDAPADEAIGVVEGWTERYDGEAWAVTVALSDPTQSAIFPPAPPINVTQPVITGVTVEGETLHCDPGTWENEPTSYAYQWIADGEWVGDGTDAYTLTAADVGHEIWADVTAINADGSATMWAERVGPVEPAPPPAGYTLTLLDDFAAVGAGAPLAGLWVLGAAVNEIPVGHGDGTVRASAYPWLSGARQSLAVVDGGIAAELVGTSYGENAIDLSSGNGYERIQLQFVYADGRYRVRYFDPAGGLVATLADGNSAAVTTPDANGHHGLMLVRKGTLIEALALDCVTGIQTVLASVDYPTPAWVAYVGFEANSGGGDLSTFDYCYTVWRIDP